MSTTGQNIINLINRYCRNYPVEFFHNMQGNRILQLIVKWIDSGGTTGSIAGAASVVPVTSSDFTSATECPLTALDGATLEVFWNEAQRFLISGEFTGLVGGGFKILISGFDATTTNANNHFFIYPR